MNYAHQAQINFWKRKPMSDRRITILSTSKLPLERIGEIPDSVDLQVIPFIEINPVDDNAVLHTLETLAAKKITAVFTSAEAVKIVNRILKDKKPDWNIYCTRTETRMAAVGLTGSSSRVRFAENASALSKKIVADGIKELFFFCGDQRLNILPEYLTNNGVTVTELIVYQTRLVPTPLYNLPDIIFFFSPSAIRSFFSVNKLPVSTRVFLIGSTTAETFKEYSGNPFIISPESDKTVVFHMALEYARTLSLHE
jgi:uroporphyrinogen-III synthase